LACPVDFASAVDNGLEVAVVTTGTRKTFADHLLQLHNHRTSIKISTGQTGCWFVSGNDLTGALHDL